MFVSIVGSALEILPANFVLMNLTTVFSIVDAQNTGFGVSLSVGLYCQTIVAGVGSDKAEHYT